MRRERGESAPFFIFTGEICREKGETAMAVKIDGVAEKRERGLGVGRQKRANKHGLKRKRQRGDAAVLRNH